MRDVVVVDSVRTGLAKSFRGSFNWTRSDDMAAFLIDALIDRNPQFDPGEIDDIILGAANQSGEQSGNLARMASFLSKLPIEATGTTVNRFRASGLQTIAMAANQIGSGYTDVMMAGGAESISMRVRQEEGLGGDESSPRTFPWKIHKARCYKQNYGVISRVEF